MKTDKLLHLVQQKKAMRSGGALPLPKAQTGVPKQNPYLPNTPLATGAIETTYSPIDAAIALMSGAGLGPVAFKLSKNIINTGAKPIDRGWLSSMGLISQGQFANNLREAYENLTSKKEGGLAKAQDGLETLVAQYKDLQNKINKGYGKESDYVKKLKQVSDKLIKEQFALETSGKVPESILNWKNPESGESAAFCIGTACYLANEAGDTFSYYSNTDAQQAAMFPESTRYLEQNEKYIEPGDIIQYKKGDSEKKGPYHAYTVLDIGKPDDRGFKPVKVVGSSGHGPIHYRDYYLSPDNKIYGSPSNTTPMATQLLKRKSSSSREYDEIVSERDKLKQNIEAIQPDYFNPKPTVRSRDFLPTDFMFNRSGWYGGNPENYSFDLPDRDRTYALGPSEENRVAEQIYPKDAKLPEILSQISNPAYKQTFMEKHNITSREYDAIAKNMLGIYGAESKFGTDYWGTGKLPEPQGISKLLGFGSVGPFQINRKSLSKDLREKYSNKDLHDPIKASEATMDFLAEGLTPKGMNLRRRAKLDKDSERYMQNVNPENYLEYLSYLHNQPKWLTGDKSTMRTEGDIVAGEHPYKKLVDYYSRLFDVLPSSIAAPVEVVGERPAYEWKRKGGLTKAQYGWMTTPSLAPVAREVMKDEIVQPMPITGYQNLVNLSNKKRQEILNAYQLNNAFKDLSGETIELTADRYKGAKVPVEYITKMYDTAIEHGIDPYKLFALAGRESTFGSGFDAASKARKDSALNLVSGWNLAEDFLPYGVDRFLADRKVPGVKVYKGNKGWSYQVTDPKAVDKYLKENPRAYGQYMETLSSLPVLDDQDAFDLASEFIKTKNISRYNPGDPDYANKIKQDYEILKRDPAFKKYVDSLRRRPTKQAAGGLTIETKKKVKVNKLR